MKVPISSVAQSRPQSMLQCGGFGICVISEIVSLKNLFLVCTEGSNHRTLVEMYLSWTIQLKRRVQVTLATLGIICASLQLNFQ